MLYKPAQQTGIKHQKQTGQGSDEKPKTQAHIVVEFQHWNNLVVIKMQPFRLFSGFTL